MGGILIKLRTCKAAALRMGYATVLRRTFRFERLALSNKGKPMRQLFFLAILNAHVSAQIEFEQSCNDSSTSFWLLTGTNVLITRLPEESPIVLRHNETAKKEKTTLESADRCYSNRDYAGAVVLFAQLASRYPNDWFIQERYARSMYWVNSLKSASFDIYRSLAQKLDSLAISDATEGGNGNGRFIAINVMFSEVYWKLGTLLLDREDYRHAIQYLHRFETYMLMTDQARADTRVMDQLYSFLTEAYFFLGLPRANRFYYCMTKQVNPQNTYVDRFKL
jgi:tetratricopeptide (TPR) repeat protein